MRKKAKEKSRRAQRKELVIKCLRNVPCHPACAPLAALPFSRAVGTSGTMIMYITSGTIYM